eukprot:439908-Alexandrium_andersonii.AAC.1
MCPKPGLAHIAMLSLVTLPRGLAIRDRRRNPAIQSRGCNLPQSAGSCWLVPVREDLRERRSEAR